MFSPRVRHRGSSHNARILFSASRPLHAIGSSLLPCFELFLFWANIRPLKFCSPIVRTNSLKSSACLRQKPNSLLQRFESVNSPCSLSIFISIYTVLKRLKTFQNVLGFFQKNEGAIFLCLTMVFSSSFFRYAHRTVCFCSSNSMLFDLVILPLFAHWTVCFSSRFWRQNTTRFRAKIKSLQSRGSRAEMIRLKPWDGLSYRVRPASLFERLRLAVVFVLPKFPKWGAFLPASSPPMFKKCPGKPPISPCQSFCQMIIWNFINLRPQKAWFHRRKFVSWQFQHARYDSDRPCGFVPPQIDKKVISKKIWLSFCFCLDFFITHREYALSVSWMRVLSVSMRIWKNRIWSHRSIPKPNRLLRLFWKTTLSKEI